MMKIIKAAFFDNEINQQDGVFGYDAHQHQDADNGRQIQRRAVKQQPAQRAAERQGQRGDDGNGLQEVAEQQNQYHQHHQYAEAHRHAEPTEHFVHIFRVAVFGRADACGQVLHDGQRVYLRQNFADSVAAVQVGFDADAPFAVEAGDGRAACGVADVGDGVQGDAAAVAGRNAQVFQGLDVVTRVFGQGGADADLAARLCAKGMVRVLTPFS